LDGLHRRRFHDGRCRLRSGPPESDLHSGFELAGLPERCHGARPARGLDFHASLTAQPAPAAQLKPRGLSSGAMNSTTSSAVEQVVLAYAALWSEPDEPRQRELMERSLTPEAQIFGPGYQFTGHSAIAAEVQRFHKEYAGTRAVLASGIDSHHNIARFAVAIVQPDGSIPHEGEDIAFFATDGRIEKVLTFWGALPAIPASWPALVTVRPGDV
jgi:hypothetical protein